MPELAPIIHLHRGGKSRSDILAAMKRQGFTITETIRGSMQLFGIELKEAKSLVTSDPSWVPAARAAEPFQKELVRLFHEMEYTDASPSPLVPRVGPK